MSITAPVTVVIPTYRREDRLRKTLQYILACRPAPGEILVHADFGDVATGHMLSLEFPGVRCINSDVRLGPGGGRNRLIFAARHEIVVSLDDDSWPVDKDFFGKASELFSGQPKLGVVACEIHEADDRSIVIREAPRDLSLQMDHCFVGCGAVIRRRAFLDTRGYIPLQHAYGMEEADLALQLLDLNYQIAFCPGLVVYHDCDRGGHHANPQINAAQIRNTGLLAFLRYPMVYWPLGLLQVLNRVWFSLNQRRYCGILSGISSIPMACWRYRDQRSIVRSATLRATRKGRVSERC